MASYHVDFANGTVVVCSAGTGSCHFDKDSLQFSSPDEARRAYEALQDSFLRDAALEALHLRERGEALMGVLFTLAQESTELDPIAARSLRAAAHVVFELIDPITVHTLLDSSLLSGSLETLSRQLSWEARQAEGVSSLHLQRGAEEIARLAQGELQPV